MLLMPIVVGLTLILFSSLAVMACMLSAQITSGEEAESSVAGSAPPARTAKAGHPRLISET